MSSLTHVDCKLSNCAFQVRPADTPGVFCSHSDKKHHLYEETCPLYRPDWTKSNAQADALRKRFGIATPK